MKVDRLKQAGSPELDGRLNKESDMEIYGLIIGLVIVVPLFVRVWAADEPDAEDQAKTLMGALD